jgi:galactofuranose transport system permease protein
VKAIIGNKLVWPLLILVTLLIVTRLQSPNFFDIRVLRGNLFGSPIIIMRHTAPTLLVALGMMLVIATRGIDLSVGAVAAISGAAAAVFIDSSATPNKVIVVLIAVAIGLGLAFACGIWNGFLVTVLGIQPIIATLVLMTAGRGVALLITDERIITASSRPYKIIGGGYWLGLPFSVTLAAVLLLLTALLTRRTALGTLLESIGINPEASRLAGVPARSITWTVYVVCALFAGVAGLMITSDATAAAPNSTGLFIEIDAILAVVIGGTSLAGGRFSITGTVIGAFIIETMTFMVPTLGIAPEITMVYKAGVVAAVCVIQSPEARGLVRRFVRTPPTFGRPSGAATPTPAAAAEIAGDREVLFDVTANAGAGEGADGR